MIRKTIIVIPTVASALNLVLWLLSYRRTLGIWCYPTAKLHLVGGVDRGYLAVSIWDTLPAPRTETIFINQPVTDAQPAIDYRIGFGSTKGRFGQALRGTTVPIWIPLVLFSAYPMIVLIRGPLRRYRRRMKGLCVKCGYDLTGNESGVRSECGSESVHDR